MKKLFINVLIVIYVLVVVFVTACLLSYNDFNVTVFGDNTWVIVKDKKFESTKKGDLLIFNKDSDIKEGDYVLFYNTFDGSNEIDSSEVVSIDDTNKDYITYNLKDDNIVVDSKGIIGNVDRANKYEYVGNILSILESRWGYLIVVVLPILFAFVYEVYAIVKELTRK